MHIPIPQAPTITPSNTNSQNVRANLETVENPRTQTENKLINVIDLDS